MSQHEDRDDMWNVRSGGPQVIEFAEAHIEEYVGKIETVLHELVSDEMHIDVHLILPDEDKPFFKLVTTGMSDLPMVVPEDMEEFQFAELLICLPPDWTISMEAFQDEKNYWPIRWLKMLARYPFQAGTWLGEGHTIPNGNPPEPLGDNTQMCGFLVTPPIFFDEEFFQLEVTEEKTINFFQLMPLYLEEMNLKVENGSEALWDRFEESFPPLMLLDPNRPNACC